MPFFDQDPRSVVNPKQMVLAFISGGGGEWGQRLELQETALITFTSQDLKGVLQGKTTLPLIEGWANRGHRIYRGEGWVTLRSPYGAPGTVMLLEELAAFGLKRAVFLGYCGSLQPEIRIGDLILPNDVLREEGTSFHYLPAGEKCIPDLDLQKRFSRLLEQTTLRSFTGKVWTTDAPYRETPQKVNRYRKEGILGVEMEMSAAFAFGKARGVSIGALLIVSDEVKNEGWETGFQSPSVHNAREQVIRCLQRYLAEAVDK